jgi:hypothetical protein
MGRTDGKIDGYHVELRHLDRLLVPAHQAGHKGNCQQCNRSGDRRANEIDRRPELDEQGEPPTVLLLQRSGSVFHNALPCLEAQYLIAQRAIGLDHRENP